QRARLVAGQLESLDVRRERGRALSDGLRGGARALREERAEAFAAADLVDGPQHRARVSEPQPRRVEEAALGALHRPGDGPSRGDGVEPKFVAAAARLEDGVGVRDTAQGAEGEDVLVLHARLAVAGALVNVLAADRARGAALAADDASLGEVLGCQARRAGERRRLEVASGQRRDRV